MKQKFSKKNLQRGERTGFYRSTRRGINRLLPVCLILIAVCILIPVSAFVDRNDLTSAKEFKNYVPASYLTKAGVTDSMTIDRALDAYITYALSFSSPTAYAYIAQLSNPAQVKIRAGGSKTGASRGDVISDGWDIEVDNGARVAIRYPGGVMHTITGPYTYTVPAYGKWGSSAAFGITPVGTISEAYATIPDTSGYMVVKKEILCRGSSQKAVQLSKVTGTVYAVHYSQNPADPKYFSIQIPAGTGYPSISDETTVVVGPKSSVIINDLDVTKLPEKTLYVFEPRFKECVWDPNKGSDGSHWREKTFFDTFSLTVLKPVAKILGWDPSNFWPRDPLALPDNLTPTVVFGVRG